MQTPIVPAIPDPHDPWTRYRVPSHSTPADLQVLVIGGANLDIAAQSLAPLVSGDSNPGKIQTSLGGVARNVAENLARLELRVSLMTLLGDDTAGQRILESARALGMDTAPTRVVAGGSTPSYLSVHNPDGDMVVAVNDMDLLGQLQPADVARQVERMGAGDAVVADCNLAAPVLAAAAHAGHGRWFAVDAVSAAKCHRLEPVLDAVHLLKLNALEAQTLAGTAVRTPGDAIQAARSLQVRGVREVVVSLGAAGVAWCDAAGDAGHLPSPSLTVRSTTGAGDALMAGLVYGHMLGWTLPQAVAWGMACAAITLGSDHANSPDLSVASVYAFAETQPGRTNSATIAP